METVVLLSDKKVDSHVSIDLDVEKLEGKSGTATYAEIKAYVEEKHGMKVSSLYIGQIKNKMGLEKRKNYNIGSGEGRVPTCPAEKEEAIETIKSHDAYVLERDNQKKILDKINKPDRRLKVYEGSDKNYKPISQIRLQGKWLEELGFEPGTPFVVNCESGKLTLTVE